MNQQLTGKKVLVLVSNGVDEEAMSVVLRDLLKAGATTKTVSTEPGLVNSWNSNNNAWGLYFPVDIPIGQALGADFDLLVVPGGLRSVQKLAANPHAERIIGSFTAAGKPICMMGEAASLLPPAGNTALTGNYAGEVAAFVQKMIAYFTGEPVMKAAA